MPLPQQNQNPPAPAAPAPAPKGDIFSAIGGFFSDLWNKALKPAASAIWHVAGGAIIGAASPSLYNIASAAVAGKPVDLHGALASTASTLIATGIGALVGLAQHSNNQEVKNLAGQVTPAVEAVIDAKVTAAVTSALPGGGK